MLVIAWVRPAVQVRATLMTTRRNRTKTVTVRIRYLRRNSFVEAYDYHGPCQSADTNVSHLPNLLQPGLLSSSPTSTRWPMYFYLVVDTYQPCD